MFIVFAAAFLTVLWIIDHLTDEYFLQAVSGRLHMTTKASNHGEWGFAGAVLEGSNRTPALIYS